MEKNPAASIKNIDDFIGANKIWCEIIGIMPRRFSTISTLRQCTVYFRILLITFACFSFIVPQVLFIAFNWGDIALLTSTGCIVTSASQLAFKIYYLLWKRDRATRMYELVNQLWNMGEDREDSKAIEKYARQAKQFTTLLSIIGYGNVATMVGVPLINVFEMRRNHDNQTDYIHAMPLHVWYGYNPLSWTNFKLAFCCQTFALTYCVVAIVAVDTSMMTLVLHMCSQFCLIQCWFKKIAHQINNDLTTGGHTNSSILFSDKIRRDIGKCIEHHKRMLIISEDVDDLLNPVILVQFATSGIEICLSGFNVMNAGSSVPELLKSMVFLATALCQLIVWCWPGEILNRESQAIGETLYMDVLWYEFPKELRMDICIVIARSQRECQITAMSFHSMSIRTLSSVFNTAGSYYALLRRLHEDE